MNNIINELQLLNEALSNESITESELVDKAIPLWMELEELRGEQAELLISKHQELVNSLAESEERIMDLESTSMTENIATEFIQVKGLQDQFNAYIEEQVAKVSFGIEKTTSPLQ